MDWYRRIFVNILGQDGHKYRAETQVLAHGQNAKIISDGMHYKSWLQPKKLFIKNARNTVENNS